MCPWCRFGISNCSVCLFHAEICHEAHASTPGFFLRITIHGSWVSFLYVYGCATLWFFCFPCALHFSIWGTFSWGLCLSLQLWQPSFSWQPLQITTPIWTSTIFKWTHDGKRYVLFQCGHHNGQGSYLKMSTWIMSMPFMFLWFCNFSSYILHNISQLIVLAPLRYIPLLFVGYIEYGEFGII